MSRATTVPVSHPEALYIGGAWVAPSTDARIDVIDAGTEEVAFSVPEATAADMARAVDAARVAFDDGPWPQLTHAERAEHIRALGAAMFERNDALAQIWPRESGVTFSTAQFSGLIAQAGFESYAALADTFPFEERLEPPMSPFGMLVREPVGVVGAIIPWNAPLSLIVMKLGPALLAGCSVVLKLSPEAPGEGYILAEAAEAAGLPAGVVNVVTADREVSELLVTNPGVDKITFTGSTAAGRRIGALCAERVARCTLELGGKSAAVVLDDADIAAAAESIASAECMLAGQVCASLTRVVVNRSRHDEMVEALAEHFAQVKVGDQFDESTQMGPLAMSRQRDRVESYIQKGIDEGATLAAGGGRPKHLDRGWFIEPTVFANVDNSSSIAQEEIFGPVLSVIPAEDERDAVRIANDTIYGLNASVFTPDVDRARETAGRIRSGTVGHNGFKAEFGMPFGGFKQSGIGREGGKEGLLGFLESKTIILDEEPSTFRGSSQ
ncbi:MAG: aldehyde dehydrogenase [Gammaproteobacteria bacterium]|nr:aldehyde dehydrogenase [Gammaproteobacteria bacterium]